MKKFICILLVLILSIIPTVAYADTGNEEVIEIYGTDELSEEVLNDVKAAAEDYFNNLSLKNSTTKEVLISPLVVDDGNGDSFGGYSYTLSAAERYVGQQRITMIQGAILAGSAGGLAKLIPELSFYLVTGSWAYNGYVFVNLSADDIIENAKYYNDVRYYWTNETQLEFKIVHNEVCVLNGKVLESRTAIYYDDMRED